MVLHFKRIVTTAVAVCGLAVAAGCHKDPQVAKREFLESGNRYAAQKKYAEAIVEYQNAVALDPNFGEARRQLAEAYDKLGDGAHAYQEFARAADLLPDNAEVQYKTGLFLLAAGRYDDAGARAQKILDKDPKSVDGLILLGLSKSNMPKSTAAVDQIEEALKIDPSRTSTYMVLAQLQLNRGDRNSAEQMFKSAVSVNPTSTDAQLALANFYLSTGRAAEAAPLFEKAVALKPTDPTVNRALGTYYMATGRMAQAEAPLKVAAQGPDAAPRLLLADYYYRVGRTADAKALVEGLKNDPVLFAETRVRLAVLEYVEKRPTQAYQLLDEVLAKEPRNPVALVLKGRCLQTEHNPAEAQPLLQAGAEAAPRLVGAQYWLGTAYRLLNRNEEAASSFLKTLQLRGNDPAASAQLSIVWLGQGKTDQALNMARDAVRYDPSFVQAHVALAKACLAKGDRKCADAEGAILGKQFAGDLDAQVTLGLLGMSHGDPVGAVRAFQKALTIDPESIDALSGVVAAYLADHKADSARNVLDPQLAKHPTDSRLLELSAEIYGAQSDTVKQEAMLRKAVEADPSNLRAYVQLAHLLMARGNMDESQKQYDAVLTREPNNVGVLTVTGLMLQLQNKKAEAIQRYERALQSDPRAGMAANNLAMLYAEDGKNLDRALNLAQTAVQQLPEAAESNDTLGWILYLKDLPSSAVGPFQKSIKQDPGNPIYHYHLGLAYVKLKDRTKARASLQQALQLKSDFEGAADARRLLRELDQGRGEAREID